MEKFASDDEPKLRMLEGATSDGLKFNAYYRCGNTHVSFQTLDEVTRARAMEAFGSDDPDFVFGLLDQLAKICGRGKCLDIAFLKFVIAVVRGVRPRDQIEASIGFYMAVINSLSIAAFEQFRRAESLEAPEEIDIAQRAINRNTRTFIHLTETLDRHRNRAGDPIVLRKRSRQPKTSQPSAMNGHRHGGVAMEESREGTRHHDE